MAVWKFFGDNYSDNAERVAKQRWNEFMKKNLTKAIVLSVLTMGALGMTSSVSAAEMGFKEFIDSCSSGGTQLLLIKTLWFMPIRLEQVILPGMY